VKRRRFLKETFCFSAAALGSGFGTSARSAETSGRYFLAIGDFGSDDQNQEAVAASMKRFVEDAGTPPDGLWLLGDNFYSGLEGGLHSKRWRTGFEEMYPASHFPGPCRVVLGNHDYHDHPGGEIVQLGYAAAHSGTRWTLPAKWYRVDFPSPEAPLVTFLCLDSNLRSVSGSRNPLTGAVRASLTEAEEAAQMVWLKAELSKPRKASFVAVVAHHPVYSNGSHGDSRGIVKDWEPLFRESGVHFYFCGHDHDLQHLEFQGHPTSFVISGAGGARARPMKRTDRGPFGVGEIYGFSEWRIEPGRFLVRHYNVERKLLHAFEKSPDGKIKMGV
jgi:hypothetical protein